MADDGRTYDARTPEQRAAVVKCGLCDWSMPRYRKSDGGLRLDIPRQLGFHVEYEHGGKRATVSEVMRGRARIKLELEDALQIAAGTEEEAKRMRLHRDLK